MAILFGKGRSTIAEHIANVYRVKELEQSPTCRKFRQVRIEGEREVERDIEYDHFYAIINNYKSTLRIDRSMSFKTY